MYLKNMIEAGFLFFFFIFIEKILKNFNIFPILWLIYHYNKYFLYI